MKETHTNYKVLPFKGKLGDVPGHEIRRHTYDWMKTPIKYVVFENFDSEAQMMVETLVHWTKWTEYIHKKWPNAHTISALILEDGQRLYLPKSYTIGFYNDETWNKAPTICKSVFKITNSYNVALEIVGVDEWSRSRRDDEATKKFLACPWERDNKKFEERQRRWANAA